ncbi:ferritin-like domain-containing protein [Actinoplanes derwentensis]|uniref:DUF2202 domain-containing protein n=1 Tax=Actinoplanes derwentensis TaxID=113562 RepID=A0A1H2DE49_9ACTN|nr:DUF2202 domain-containing protein [Actinoplanes derwentensis]GID90420.1 hypothetical protein Ade03nite_93440 [Actinoplanes derwentensis]SDT80859.1 hypothetical protein SAMN04489716_9391 [Actinoplanes derwentensis]
MRTTTRRAAVLVAAGALGLSGLAAASAMAAASPFAGHPVVAATPGPGWSDGMGSGYGKGGSAMMGIGARDGSCLEAPIAAAKGTLSEAQKTTLVAMAQEEKAAHDLYTAFAGKYDAIVFDRIAASEARHLTTVRTLLSRYGVADPTTGEPAGKFSDPAAQASYDTLLAQGQAGQAAALQVGVTVEQTDIADLTAALGGLSAPDVTQVYTQLRMASQHHLAAFQNWSTR